VDQLLTYYAQRPLVGREAVVERLMRFGSQEAPGCLLVEAEAMFGKSALLAHLVRCADEGTWSGGPVPDIVFFFVREEQKRNTAAAFLAAVNAQLLALLRSPAGVIGDLEAQRSQLFQLWKQAGAEAGPYRPLLLLVDGLDEMAPDGLTILDVVPGADQPYVHILVSSRPWVLPVLGQEHPLGTAARLHLDRLDEQAIADLLVRNGAGAGAAASLAPRIERMTRGEPLFSSVVSADVAAGGEARLADLEAQGVTAVSDYLRADVAQLEARLVDASEEVVGVLAASTGGIAVEEIAAVLGLSKLRVEKAVAPIRRFLRGGGRLRLMHREVQRMVEERLGAEAVQSYAARVATWCATFVPRWPEGMPDYPIRHGVGHLADQARAEDDPVRRAIWTEGLADAVGPRFIDLHERRVDRLRWLMLDLDDALDACAGDTGAGGALRVIITATVDARFRCGGLRPAVIFERARLGDIDGARARLDAVAIDEPWRQAALLLCAWLAPEEAAGWAHHMLRALSPALAPGLEVLAGRVAVDLEGAPAPAMSLVPPPDQHRAQSIVAQIGGGGSVEGEPVEPVVSGEQVGWEIERNRLVFRQQSLGGSVAGPPASVSPDAGPVYRAETEGPLLVSFAAASPGPGADLLRDYISLHAANPYTQYRNRSLWAVLQSVAHHPDPALVAELVEQLVAAALGVGTVVVADCVPLTALAILAAWDV
ncbi:MAG TPA: NACHT domain-containing protein, partial [Acidimicrobiales bacterium]|nr:NACHT domain-containing protein [Acidimicrobiales bacterium]